VDEETALARAQRLTRFMEPTPPDCWTNDGAVQSPVQHHVFLVGFPRSGTTLLGQVLAASPDIEVLDESDCLLDSYRFLASDAALDELAAKSSAELEPERAAYWRRVGDAGIKLDRAAFVDKMPLNSVVLCLIAKLFPDAKILVALRDPRDVVFSSFRRRFALTPQMYELLTPQSAAAYYDAVMSLLEIYRRKLPLEFFDARYERIVSEFESEMARVCRSIGVNYNPSMADFASGAGLERINTPSVEQVARGLYAEGVGHWRRYQEQLQPQLSLLAPWVTRFGYDEA